MSYVRDEVKTPVLSGVALRAFVSAVESAVGPWLLDKVIHDSGIDRWRETSAADAPPQQHPLPHPTIHVDASTPQHMAHEVIATADNSRPHSVSHFVEAYKNGSTPLAEVRKVHEAIARLDERDERLGLFIARKADEALSAAEESTKRLANGTARSVLEGIPVVLKDEIDVAGYPTTLGTRFRTAVAETDSAVAARLKAAGAVILGKANMHEIGINTIGVNAWHGAARNPWNRKHITGGSSSASAAVVAAGLCPISVGADGGGSIRIPAALCGVVGLKATWGRIPETGIPPLCWSVGHVGPIGLTVDDVATLYAILAGSDPGDLISMTQPHPHLADYRNSDLRGLKLGVCWPWFEDAAPEVVQKCREALNTLVSQGAKFVEIPAPDPNTLLWTHTTIILCEMAQAMRAQIDKDITQFGLDTRTNLAIGQHLRGMDYIHALQHRHQFTRHWLKLMHDCDVVVTPSSAITAPQIVEKALPHGESNLPVSDALMRFIRLANVTGFPAISVPAGFDSTGLPVGLHLMGRPYEEALLLRLARIVECQVETRVPDNHLTNV